MRFFLFVFVLLVLPCIFHTPVVSADPWKALQQKYEKGCDRRETNIQHEKDPWARLRAVYLPFTEAEERAASKHKDSAGKVSRSLHRILEPFAHIIKDTSNKFNVPPEIIGAVIMVESGGDPSAGAETSSAKGLMQTIDSTFREAREDLAMKGVLLPDDPFDPSASITAGTWYLDQMFVRAKAVHGREMGSRDDIMSWRYPLQYYYAGPGNGQKKSDKVIVYAKGKRIIVNKSAYSKKVLKWADILGDRKIAYRR